jgi:3-dehydroquinate synthase
MYNILNIKSQVSDYKLGFVNSLDSVISVMQQDNTITIIDSNIEALNINTKLVVIGGGILQDLVGFCASIYARGIEYILIPTTLLAQTDSCVGGKTSINL